MRFGLKFLRTLPKLMKACHAPNGFITEQSLEPETIYHQMQFSDMWEDAEMETVIRYLKGNKSLTIPNYWRPFLFG